MSIKAIVNCRNELGEGPLWNSAEGALYWVDIHKAQIQRYQPKSEQHTVFKMPFKVTALGLRKNGGFVCASEQGFSFWDASTGALKAICHPEQGKQGARFNDGKVDRSGRFWAGSMTAQGASSALYRLDCDLKVTCMAQGITISNGIGWSPDNRRMYYVDSLRYRIYAYHFSPESGEIDKQQIFAQFEAQFGIPDGLTVDSQGFIWCAFYDGWKIVRFNPNGQIDRVIEMPVARPTCPAFGGENLDELYVTSAIDGLTPKELEKQPNAGDLFVLQPGVKGLPEPKFAG